MQKERLAREALEEASDEDGTPKAQEPEEEKVEEKPKSKKRKKEKKEKVKAEQKVVQDEGPADMIEDLLGLNDPAPVSSNPVQAAPADDLLG